jgi:hypothetical protein
VSAIRFARVGGGLGAAGAVVVHAPPSARGAAPTVWAMSSAGARARRDKRNKIRVLFFR